MIVQINSSPSEKPEWGLIELNGELIMPNDEGNKDLELGSLTFDDETPVMIVGSHELRGSIIKLKQPFAVLRKQKGSESDVEYEVVGMITKKVLFDQYPKSIMR